MQNSSSNQKLLNIEELSVFLGIKKSTLYTWIHEKRIEYIKVGRLVKFDKHKINAWLEKHTHKEKSI
ncbi:MAG: helix-turn-helix domain-containing protein [Candidatus Omnitrophica bacterium]|nr:helix-turn-helix domain-containing protein [Candidatus Omnitrophota bacterium]